MASTPQRIYTRLKIEMKNAYYTDTMENNLENFRTEASVYLSPGDYSNLSFLKICEHLEGKGVIGVHKLSILKQLVETATVGKAQLLEMIEKAEKEIQELSGTVNRMPATIDAQKQTQKGDEIIVSMKEEVYRVNEGSVAFIDCSVDPEPKRIIWKKGDQRRINTRIPMNCERYHCTGPRNPTLIIRSVKKKDEAYYQCTAKDVDTVDNKEIEFKGDAVLLKVASGAVGSDGDRDGRWFSLNRDRSFRSRSPEYKREENQRPKALHVHIWSSHCDMVFDIPNYDEMDGIESIIQNAFIVATGQNRIQTIDVEKKCIRVIVRIKGGDNLSEAPAVCLAEEFKNYLLDVGLQISEESNDILEVDETSIKITPEHMPADGHPLVNVSHPEFSVNDSEAVSLQTYIISSPPVLSIDWFRINSEGNEIPIKVDSKKYYGGSHLSPSLIIRNVDVDDQGWYVCRVTNSNGTGCSQETFVRIKNESTRPKSESEEVLPRTQESSSNTAAHGSTKTLASDIPESTRPKETDVLPKTQESPSTTAAHGSTKTLTSDIPVDPLKALEQLEHELHELHALHVREPRALEQRERAQRERERERAQRERAQQRAQRALALDPLTAHPFTAETTGFTVDTLRRERQKIPEKKDIGGMEESQRTSKEQKKPTGGKDSSDI